MPKADIKHVQDLTLDRKNYRTLPQPSETAALKAMLAVNPTKFWALMESLLDDGYHLTENILVLRSNAGGDLIVKEGNQRIAAIKLALGLINSNEIDIPDYIQTKIAGITAQTKANIERVPCAVYGANESETVDKIVALTHGKGQKASRTGWNAVAAARHSRDKSGATESGLDLLEKYIKHGSNLSDDQKALWAGDYKLTVLDEALGKIAPRLGFANGPELVAAYPSKLNKASDRTGLEKMLYDIGAETLGFPQIRDDNSDFAADRYGFKPQAGAKKGSKGSTGKSGAGKTAKPKKKTASKPKALSSRDPRSVINRLGAMPIRGANRDKVEALRQEAVLLKIDDTPLAFCFVLRSMFELAANAYCEDHKADGLSMVTAAGSKKLVAVLQEITKHLTKNNKDITMVKLLHGAMAELGRPASVLSVTSMNQLVHNPNFSARPPDISSMFNDIAPLLEAMNA